MDIGSLFLLAALVSLVVWFIGRPLIAPWAKPSASQLYSGRMLEYEHSTLLAKRDQVMNALKELDFDNALGKIPEGDYPSRREALLKAGAQVLRELDLADNISTSEESVSLPITQEDADLESLIAARRRSHHEKAAGFCPQCGNPVQKSDKYCCHCGRTQ